MTETDQVEESEQARGEPERHSQYSCNSVSNPENFKVASELKADGFGEDSSSSGQEVTSLEGAPSPSGQSTTG